VPAWERVVLCVAHLEWHSLGAGKRSSADKMRSELGDSRALRYAGDPEAIRVRWMLPLARRGGAARWRVAVRQQMCRAVWAACCCILLRLPAAAAAASAGHDHHGQH
jgi:hypothetical protein